jgi:TonB family protein
MPLLLRVLFGIAVSILLAPAQDSNAPAPDPVALEQKLLANPNNDDVRSALMDAYLKANDPEAYAQQVFWLIENRPASPVLGTKGKLKPSGGVLNSASDYQEAKSDWEVQLEKRSQSPAVLYNAAVFLTPSDPVRAVDLLEQARKLAPAQPAYVAAEGTAYLMAFVRDADGNPSLPLTLDSANALRARLTGSSDAELLSGAGKVLVTDGRDPAIKKAGLRLMQRASYEGPKWRSALAEVSPESSVKRTGAMRITSAEAEANLIDKVAPAYPPLAKSGRIEGVVTFTATIDEDGSVQHLDLVSGPPLLVSAARDAVLQWQYKATVVNNKPVAVVTDVSVNFSLSQ